MRATARTVHRPTVPPAPHMARKCVRAATLDSGSTHIRPRAKVGAACSIYYDIYAWLWWWLYKYSLLSICPANLCQCSNGSPTYGAACTTHNAHMCESCNVGFRINPHKTACQGWSITRCPVAWQRSNEAQSKKNVHVSFLYSIRHTHNEKKEKKE